MKKRKFRVMMLTAAAVGVFAGPIACSPARDVRSILDDDLHPPRLLGAEMTGTRTAVVRLSKAAEPIEDVFRLEVDADDGTDGESAGDSSGEGSDNGAAEETDDDSYPGESTRSLEVAVTRGEAPHLLHVEFGEESEPGTRYTLGGAAEDENGNSLQFVVYLYGYNPDLPEVQINEFNTRRSANHPEIVELFVLEDGNLGGMTVTNGTASDFNSRYVFPGVETSAGEYVLVHFRPEGIAEEIDELGDDLTLSGGLNSHDEARDVWVRDGAGLPGNNGTIVVYESPGGGIVDAAPYTNRTSESDERYDGFGSTRMLEWVGHIVDEGAWVIEGANPRPEDLIWIDDSTATRSINRMPGAPNTRSRSDWHTAPTRGSTWGEENTTEIYEP